MGVGGPRLFVTTLLPFFVALLGLSALFGIALPLSPVPMLANIFCLPFLVLGTLGYHYVDHKRTLAYTAAMHIIRKQNVVIQKSLREKELLLKEVHHRVKNNLQMVYSLLNLQAEHVQNQSVLDALNISKNRIQSMSMVHQELYQSDEVKWVDTAKYIPKLLAHLEQLYEDPSAPIQLEHKLASILCTIGTTVPIGLVVNEIVTNAYQHREHANITTLTVLSEMKGDSMWLSIEDNGSGVSYSELQQSEAAKENRSFGLQLIRDLVAQLKGTLHIKADEGTQFRIEIPLEQQK